MWSFQDCRELKIFPTGNGRLEGIGGRQAVEGHMRRGGEREEAPAGETRLPWYHQHCWQGRVTSEEPAADVTRPDLRHQEEGKGAQDYVEAGSWVRGGGGWGRLRRERRGGGGRRRQRRICGGVRTGGRSSARRSSGGLDRYLGSLVLPCSQR